MASLKQKVAAAEKRGNAARAKKGQPPKVWGSGGASSLEAKAKYFKIKINAERPPRPPNNRYNVDAEQIKRYFRQLKELLYERNSGPSINVVLFLAGDESFSDQKKDELRSYVHFFGGKHRIIRGFNEIQAAASAGAL